ncbi:asparagine synthase (glutamine-hydrolyzing) [Rhodoflexus caldus]|uniref:asparagine synthase (glutamine-hydrolyzing) n=1 Tax=Rhodoflexus caldus TaxID=2891236 RepID=UPI00202A9A7A|nr:asparagine synthase (glutamine-hydrolyzing) [Rhodoflexus caldus]
MCGISGIITDDKRLPIGDLVRMNQIIRHRGPDDEGFVLFNDADVEVCGGADTAAASWQYPTAYQPQSPITDTALQQAEVALGHRRLSILDLSPKGHQPMCDAERRYWITFNGEVYNYIEIRRELETMGFRFSTDTDTEVIINSYKAWGTDCQHKFNGMWAFAIYDRQEKRIFLSRDRFGIKPLYYWVSPAGLFYFGSEIKQFTVCSGWRAVLNQDMAADYLLHSLTDHTDETLFKGVYQLLPGHCLAMTIDRLPKSGGQKVSQHKWYHAPRETFTGTFNEAKNIFRERFQSAVELHLRADVPVGSALSGGLDSSAIVSYVNVLLKQQGKEELQKTFSSCSQDKRYDEREWMDEVVRHTNVDGHFVYPKGEDVFTLTEQIIWHMDEPYQSQSAFLGYHVFQEARKNGVIVLLNGQGADEYLSCYGELETLRLRQLLRRCQFGRLRREMAANPWISLSTLFYLELPLQVRLRLSGQARKRTRLHEVINHDLLAESKGIHPYERQGYQKKDAQEITNYQMLVEPLQKYLHWEDRNSMAHGIEARVPFLDYRLVEFTRSLPLDYLTAHDQTKKVMIHALEGILPETVRNRKDKKGFITPEQRWFLEDYSREFLDLFDTNVGFTQGLIKWQEGMAFLQDMQAGKIPFDYAYWRLILFSVWMKRFSVTID